MKTRLEAIRSSLWECSTEELDLVYQELVGSGRAMRIDVMMTNFQDQPALMERAIADVIGSSMCERVGRRA